MAKPIAKSTPKKLTLAQKQAMTAAFKAKNPNYKPTVASMQKPSFNKPMKKGK
jgi:hypothetical protein